MFILKQLFKDQLAYMRHRYGTEQQTVEVYERDFADKVCILFIYIEMVD